MGLGCSAGMASWALACPSIRRPPATPLPCPRPQLCAQPVPSRPAVRPAAAVHHEQADATVRCSGPLGCTRPHGGCVLARVHVPRSMHATCPCRQARALVHVPGRPECLFDVPATPCPLSSAPCSAPPAPVAALLSPVLWRLNTPDRFDMYRCVVSSAALTCTAYTMYVLLRRSCAAAVCCVRLPKASLACTETLKHLTLLCC